MPGLFSTTLEIRLPYFRSWGPSQGPGPGTRPRALGPVPWARALGPGPCPLGPGPGPCPLGPGPGPKGPGPSQGPGPGTRPRALGPGPWALSLGPGPWALSLGPGPWALGPWALSPCLEIPVRARIWPGSGFVRAQGDPYLCDGPPYLCDGPVFHPKSPLYGALGAQGGVSGKLWLVQRWRCVLIKHHAVAREGGGVPESPELLSSGLKVSEP